MISRIRFETCCFDAPYEGNTKGEYEGARDEKPEGLYRKGEKENKRSRSRDRELEDEIVKLGKSRTSSSILIYKFQNYYRWFSSNRLTRNWNRTSQTNILTSQPVRLGETPRRWRS